MSNSPFSLRLQTSLKARLDEEARHQDRSASYIATKAIELFLDERDRKRSAVELALADADRGAFVSSGAVNDWMETWGGENELHPPKADVFIPIDKG